MSSEPLRKHCSLFHPVNGWLLCVPIVPNAGTQRPQSHSLNRFECVVCVCVRLAKQNNLYAKCVPLIGFILFENGDKVNTCHLQPMHGDSRLLNSIRHDTESGEFSKPTIWDRPDPTRRYNWKIEMAHWMPCRRFRRYLMGRGRLCVAHFVAMEVAIRCWVL